jgi:hypothetical protein
MSPECQNEMLAMLRDSILKQIVATILSESQQFAVVVDGAQDCTGCEQEYVCIRYVDSGLQPQEVFVGLYETPDTCDNTIAGVIKDSLTRLCLPINDLRAQTYGGASNMFGLLDGCLVKIAKEHPLATWFYFGVHCANLTAQSAASASRCNCRDT